MKNPVGCACLGVASVASQHNGMGLNKMVALTIIIGGAVFVVLVIAAVRGLRRASRRIDDIIREELDEPEDD